MPSFEKDLPGMQAPALSNKQFAKLVELLQPGYELSTLMLADYKARCAQALAELEVRAKNAVDAKDKAAAANPPDSAR